MNFIKQLLILSCFIYLVIQGGPIVTKLPAIISLQNAKFPSQQNPTKRNNKSNLLVQTGEPIIDADKNKLDKNVQKSKFVKRMPKVPTSETTAIHSQRSTTDVVKLVTLEDTRAVRKDKLKAGKQNQPKIYSTSKSSRDMNFQHNNNLPVEVDSGANNQDEELVEHAIQENIEGIVCVKHCLQVLDDYLLDKTKYEENDLVKENVAAENVMENGSKMKNINRNNYENKIANYTDSNNEHCIDLRQFDKCILKCQNTHFFVVLEELTNVLPAILQIAYKCDHKWVEKSNNPKSKTNEQKSTGLPNQSQVKDKLSNKQSDFHRKHFIAGHDDQEDKNDLKPDFHPSNKNDNFYSNYKDIDSLPVLDSEKSARFSTGDILGEAAEVEQLILVQENHEDLENQENNENLENHEIQEASSTHRDPVEIAFSKNDNVNLNGHLTQLEWKVETEESRDFHQNYPGKVTNEVKVPLNRHNDGEI